MVILNRPLFFHLSIHRWQYFCLLMFICYTPHLMLSPSHFQNFLSTSSVGRVNGMRLWDFCASDSQRALKILIIAELSIVMTISPSKLRHFLLMRQAWVATDNSLFSLFWKYYALSFLLRQRRRVEVLSRKIGIISIIKVISTYAFLEVSGGFAELLRLIHMWPSTDMNTTSDQWPYLHKNIIFTIY